MENNVNNSEKIEQANAKKEEKKALSREVITYLIFGVLTTFVGWAVYFAVMIGGRALFSIPNDDTSSGGSIALYTVAQIIQWVLAVLFAYYTNKKWVFEADNSQHEKIQIASFFGARLFSLGCDSAVTFGVVFALTSAGYIPFALNLPLGINVTFTPDFWAKLAAAVVVIVLNYILSKFVVFKKK